jgi:phytanoyl-CoA hydroxylase
MTPRTLAAAERRAYERDGFVIVPEVLPLAECRLIDAEIRAISTEQFGGDEEAQMILQLGLRSPLTRRICVDERLLALVEDLVHPGIAIYSAKMVGKVPGRAQVCHWHQDESYYVQLSQAGRRMSLWLALHDSDARNGGVWFVPGSHRWGLQRHAQRDSGQCAYALLDPPAERLKLAVCPPVAAGAAVLFDSLTWHHSAGEVDRVRRAFIVSYQDALAPGGNGAQWTIVRPAPPSAAPAT